MVGITRSKVMLFLVAFVASVAFGFGGFRGFWLFATSPFLEECEVRGKATRPPPRFGTRIQLVSERGFGSFRNAGEMVSGEWFLGRGFWEVVSGKWFLGSGFWRVVSGGWFLASGFWEVVSGKWFLGSGFREVVSGEWFLGAGFWEVVSGKWFLGSGFWGLASGDWFLGSGFWGLVSDKCISFFWGGVVKV